MEDISPNMFFLTLNGNLIDQLKYQNFKENKDEI